MRLDAERLIRLYGRTLGCGEHLLLFGGVLHAFDDRALALWKDRELATAALAAGATARGNRWRR